VWAGAVLDGVNVASMALMVVVTWHLGRSALIDPLTISIAAISGALLLWNRVNSGWLILAGGVLGLVVGS
jgi:chromate transporter